MPPVRKKNVTKKRQDVQQRLKAQNIQLQTQLTQLQVDFNLLKTKNDDYEREREREREREQNWQAKKENNQLVPFLLETSEENEELFTRIWNLREEIFSLTQIDQITQQELLTKSLELYQKDRTKRKSLISQIQKKLLSQIGKN